MIDDKGSVGVITYFFLLILFIAFFYLLFGSMIDGFFATAATIAANDPDSVSPERNVALNQMIDIWMAFPILVLIMLGYFAIKNALRERSGDVT